MTNLNKIKNIRKEVSIVEKKMEKLNNIIRILSPKKDIERLSKLFNLFDNCNEKLGNLTVEYIKIKQIINNK